MNSYRYLLFDADETLFDFQKAEHEAFHLTCDAGGIEFSEEIYQVYSEINDALWKLLEKGGTTLPELKLERYRQLLEHLRYPEEGMIQKAAEMRDLYVDFLRQQAFLIPDAVEVCRTLSERYTLYIITNGISRIQRARLAKTPIKEYIADIFISEEIGTAKPAAAYFDYVFEKIGDADKSKYLVIGDSLSSDIKGAVNYGLDSCWVNRKGMTTDLPVTYTVNTLHEIFDIFN